MTDESRRTKTNDPVPKASRPRSELVRRDAVEALQLVVGEQHRAQAPPLCKKIRRLEHV